MYPNSHLRWAGPSSNYTKPVGDVHASASFWHSGILYFAIAATLFSASAVITNALVGQQVVYTPTLNTENIKPPITNPTLQAPKESHPVVAAATPTVNNSPQIQAVLDSWVKSHTDKHWSIAVQGLDANTFSASVNANNPIEMASIYKLYLMYPLFQKYSLTQLTNLSINIEGKGLVNYKTCIELMIKNSDNQCGEAVGANLGWTHSNNMINNLGLKNTVLNNPNGFTTSASDAALFLQKLYGGQVLSSENQQFVLGLMQHQKFRSGIPAGCPSCIVYDKTGDLRTVRHDAGIVKYAAGIYVLSIFTNGASYSQIAQLTHQIQAQI